MSMHLPADGLNLRHAFGGDIVRIDRVAHECLKPKYGRSRDGWFFVGTVRWDHGGEITENVQIAPCAVRYGDDQRAQGDALMDALNDYLLAHGTWCDHGSGHDGWFANERPAEERAAHRGRS